MRDAEPCNRCQHRTSKSDEDPLHRLASTVSAEGRNSDPTLSTHSSDGAPLFPAVGPWIAQLHSVLCAAGSASLTPFTHVLLQFE
eukprot:CAMPEP_0180565594 /NCGR_PEP_ID=MMETSP1037_2-20121125/5634_1 /TAXON_ID=632150 /ORGANISM="Azadinium spinosum, Strain 3D9" /LENGTH=84 /DNA_ID=CAMNT_0022582585 /DNA_START=184 /DNA_END=438 /DNA_ORIENTATION=-